MNKRKIAASILAAAATFIAPEKLNLRGRFDIEVTHADGSVDKHVIHNTITTEGKNLLLNSFFRNNAPPTNWYFGLIDNAGFTAVAATDTMAAHPGWTEFTLYTEANRQSWTPGAASSAQITNGTAATFTINATGAIAGILITSNNTIGGTTGTSWSAALFAAELSVVNTDSVKVTYTLGA